MRGLLIAGLVLTSSAGMAEQAVISPSPVSAGPQVTLVSAGTAIQLHTLSELSTKYKKLKIGDRFNLSVSENVMTNGAVIIPAGSTAVGEVTLVRNKGMFGKSGLIEARLLYLRVDDRLIRLTGRMDDKGVAGGVGAGAATYATLVGGFFVTGTSAVIPAGTVVTGYIDEDITSIVGAREQNSPKGLPIFQFRNFIANMTEPAGLNCIRNRPRPPETMCHNVIEMVSDMRVKESSAGFDSQGLSLLRFSVPDYSTATVYEALKAKYGEPYDQKDDEVRNRFGATFPRKRVFWRFREGFAVLESPSDQLDQTAFIFVANREADKTPPKVDF